MSAMGCKHWAKGLLCTHKPQHTHTHPRHTAVEGSMAHKSHRIRVDFFFELVGAFQRVFKGPCAQHSWSSASGERLEISWGLVFRV